MSPRGWAYLAAYLLVVLLWATMATALAVLTRSGAVSVAAPITWMLLIEQPAAMVPMLEANPPGLPFNASHMRLAHAPGVAPAGRDGGARRRADHVDAPDRTARVHGPDARGDHAVAAVQRQPHAPRPGTWRGPCRHVRVASCRRASRTGTRPGGRGAMCPCPTGLGVMGRPAPRIRRPRRFVASQGWG